MRSLLLIFALYMLPLVMLGQDVKNGEVKTYFEKGELKTLTTYKDGVKNGLEEIYHEPGKLWKRMHYVNGQLNGYYEEYSKYTGKLSEAGNFVNNNKNGLWKNFAFRFEEEYKDGQKHGKYIGYHADSTLALRSAYINGKLDGKYESWHKNGKPKEVAIYKAGILNGERKIWYDDGKPQASGKYINGVAEGIFRFYSGNKRTLTHEANFKNGKLEGRERQWNYDGDLIRESYYNADIPTVSLEFGKTPTANYKEKYKKGYLSEKWIWSSNGRKTYHKVAINDSVYTDTLWYNNGKIHFVHVPDIKSNTLKYTVWYEDGKLKKEGQLVGNRWHGEWAYYAADGKKLTEAYNNGIREKALADADTKEKDELVIKNAAIGNNTQPEFFFGEDYSEWPVGDMAFAIERNHEDNAFDLQLLEDGSPAIYPGGDEAVVAFIQNRLASENTEAENHEKVTQTVQIVVDKSGNASMYYTSETRKEWKDKIEAAVAQMQTWQPAVYKGKFVRRTFEYKISY